MNEQESAANIIKNLISQLSHVEIVVLREAMVRRQWELENEMKASLSL